MAAETGNKYAEGNDGGRPTSYKPEYNEQAYKLCLLGATDEDLANFFDVCEKTINNWKEDHEEFLQSIRAGKTKADIIIAENLYKSAQDKKITREVPFKVKKVYWEEGKRCEQEEVVLIEVSETVPADFRSMQFWLNNRQRSKWSTKQEVDHTTNGKDINHIVLGKGVEPPQE